MLILTIFMLGLLICGVCAILALIVSSIKLIAEGNGLGWILLVITLIIIFKIVF